MAPSKLMITKLLLILLLQISHEVASQEENADHPSANVTEKLYVSTDDCKIDIARAQQHLFLVYSECTPPDNDVAYYYEVTFCTMMHKSTFIGYKSLHISSTCEPTEVVNTTLAEFALKVPDEFYKNNDLLLKGSALQQLQGNFVSFQSYDSIVDNLTINAYYLRLEGSSVYKLSVNISSPTEEPASRRAVQITNSSISNLKVIITGSQEFSMLDSNVGEVESLQFNSSNWAPTAVIRNCTIDVLSKGAFIPDSLKLQDVVIKNAKYGAFNVSISSELILENVAFMDAEPGVIYAINEEGLIFHNVTVKGNLIDNKSIYVKYRKIDKPIFILNLMRNSSYCKIVDDDVTCDLTKNNKMVLTRGMMNAKRYLFNNVKQMASRLTCPDGVTLNNVTFAYLSEHLTCSKKININVTDSLSVLKIGEIGDFTVRNAYLRIRSTFNADGMNFMNLSTKFLSFNLINEGDETAVWNNISIVKTGIIYIRKPIAIENLNIVHCKESWTFDHPGGISFVQNLTVDYMSCAFTVKSGTLKIDTLNLKSLRKLGPIFELFNSAKLLLKNVQFDAPFLWFTYIVPLIRTENIKQIEFEDADTAEIFEHRVTVVQSKTNTVSADNPYCKVQSNFHLDNLLCDFQNNSLSNIMLRPFKKENYLEIIIENAESIEGVYPCATNITLNNIGKVSMQHLTERCHTFQTLTLKDVLVYGVTVQENNFEADNITSPYIITAELTTGTMLINNSYVTGIFDVSTTEIFVKNSSFSNITSFHVHLAGHITQSEIYYIHERAVHVDVTSVLEIEDSTIEYIMTNGIINAGDLVFRNVIIRNFFPNAVLLKKYSTTTFINCTFEHFSLDPFVASSGARLVFHNVTLNGKHLYVRTMHTIQSRLLTEPDTPGPNVTIETMRTNVTHLHNEAKYHQIFNNIHKHHIMSEKQNIELINEIIGSESVSNDYYDFYDSDTSWNKFLDFDDNFPSYESLTKDKRYTGNFVAALTLGCCFSVVCLLSAFKFRNNVRSAASSGVQMIRLRASNSNDTQLLRSTSVILSDLPVCE